MSYIELAKLANRFRSLAKCKPYYVDESEISGNGVFARYPITKGSIIGTAITDEKGAINDEVKAITYIGSQINHQFDCNAKLVKNKTKGYDLVTIKDIAENQEITTNYKDAPWYINKDTDGFLEL